VAGKGEVRVVEEEWARGKGGSGGRQRRETREVDETEGDACPGMFKYDGSKDSCK